MLISHSNLFGEMLIQISRKFLFDFFYDLSWIYSLNALDTVL